MATSTLGMFTSHGFNLEDAGGEGGRPPALRFPLLRHAEALAPLADESTSSATTDGDDLIGKNLGSHKIDLGLEDIALG